MAPESLGAADLRIIEHDYRLKAVEKGHEVFLNQLKVIEDRSATRLDALSLKLDSAMQHMRSHACPSPDLCGKMQRDMVVITSEVQRLEKLAERNEKERQEVVEKLNNIQTDIAVSKGGLRVTIFWVGIMASAVGGGAAIFLPLLFDMLRGQ